MSKEITAEAHQRFNLSTIATLLISIGSLLLPLFFLPGLGLDISKKFLLSFAVLLAAVVWLIGRLRAGKLEVPLGWFWPASGLLLLASLVAALFSDTIMHSLVGFGFEQDTFLSFVVLLITMLLLGILFASREKILNFYLLLFAGGMVIFVIQVLGSLIPTGSLPFGLFPTRSFNLIGKWNSFGIYFGFLAVTTLAFLELFSVRGLKLLRALLVATLIASLLVVAVVNFQIAWWVVGIMALAIYLYAVSFSDKAERRFYRPALVVVVVALVFIVFGQPTGILGKAVNRMNEGWKISVLEVRPSFSGTMAVAKQTLTQKPIFGAGPNNFPREWLRYKPAQVNETPFWNLTFDTGIGTIPSFAITWGLVGISAWVLFLAVFIYYGFRGLFTLIRNKQNHSLLFLSLVGALYFWIFALVYAADTVILSFAFICSGLFIAALTEAKIIKTREFSLFKDPRINFASSLVLVLVIFAGLAGTYLLTQKVWSITLFQRALAAGQSGNLDLAKTIMTRAVSKSNSEMYYRTLVEINLAQLQRIVSSQSEPQEKLIADFQSTLNQAIDSAEKAIALNKTNYINWLYQGRVYESLVPLKIERSYEEAVNAYNTAKKLNPTSPDIYLDFARLEVANGNTSEARDYVNQALKLKSNYTTGILFLAQLEEKEGNLSKALKRANQAAVLAPNDVGVLFQAGLFSYRAREYEEAITLLERSVAISPSYANARYFLGLAYDQVGRTSLAIEQFEKIALTNPNNKELTSILNNLRAGRGALSTETSKKDSAPIEE